MIPIIIIVIAAVIALIPVFRYYAIAVTWNECDDIYATKYTSMDGHVSFICDNKKGLIGDGGYIGTYTDINGQVYEMELMKSSFCYACIDDDIDHLIFGGKTHLNIYTNVMTVEVEEVGFEKSIYQPGDKIVFHKDSN